MTQPNKLRMMRSVLRVALLVAAASCVLGEKGDLYGKDSPQKDSIVEQVCRRPSAPYSRVLAFVRATLAATVKRNVCAAQWRAALAAQCVVCRRVARQTQHSSVQERSSFFLAVCLKAHARAVCSFRGTPMRAGSHWPYSCVELRVHCAESPLVFCVPLAQFPSVSFEPTQNLHVALVNRVKRRPLSL